MNQENYKKMKSTSKEYKKVMTQCIKKFEDPKDWDKALQDLEEVQKCHKVIL